MEECCSAYSWCATWIWFAQTCTTHVVLKLWWTVGPLCRGVRSSKSTQTKLTLRHGTVQYYPCLWGGWAFARMHVSRTHRVALAWLFDRINLDSKIQVKYIDTKNQFAHILSKGNVTRDEWNRLLCLFNISHFSSTNCSGVMSKRTQKDAGEERVIAKSRPMMSLIPRCSERTFDVLASAASESPVKTRHESQSPLMIAQAEMYDSTVKPIVCRDISHGRHRLVEKAHSSSCSAWNIDKTWSSQEWKSDELVEDRTVRPVVCPHGGAHTSQTRFSREHKNVILEEEENHDGTGRLVVCPQRGAPQHFVIEDDVEH